MRIGLNLLYLIPGKVGGTETYARNLLSALVADLAPADHLYLYVPKECAGSFPVHPQVSEVVFPFYATSRLIRLLFEQLVLPLYLFKQRINILLSLGYTTPLLCPCPDIVTIHDLNWYYHPEDFSMLELIAWKTLVNASSKSSSHIIAVSQATADSLTQVLHVPKSKISPILSGIRPVKTLKGSQEKKILHKLGIKKPYLFTVLAGYPHKNLRTLLAAFKQLHVAKTQLQLVVCGLAGRADQENLNYLTKHHLTDAVRILGYVDEQSLSALYQAAEIFVFPSAYEGFGFPVPEAMAHHTPVVSSNAFSLPELAGSAALYVDPYCEEGYQKQITKLLKSPSLQQELVKKGDRRVSELKWENTAKKTWQLIKKYANSR